MLSELKRLAAHTSVYGLSNIISRSITFLLLPIHTHLLSSRTEFGEVTLFIMFISFTNVLFLLGFDTAFFRFYMMPEKGYTVKNVFSTAFYTICSVSIVLSALIYFKADFISRICLPGSEYGYIVKWAAGILLFDALAVLPFLVLRAENRPVLFMVFKLINVILTIAFNVVFILMRGKEGVFIANFAASVITFLMVCPIIMRRLTINLSKTVFAGLMKFGLPYIFPGLSVVSVDLIDRYFIEIIHGEDMVGLYSASYRISMIMWVVISAFRFAWHPFFMSVAQRDDAKAIYARVLTYFILLTGWVYLFVSYFVRTFVSIKIPFTDVFLIPQIYWSGLTIVPVVMLAYIFSGIYVNFIVGIYIKKQSQYLPFITITAASVNVVLNFVLIPPYGMMGAAVSTAISYAVMTVILYGVTRKIYPITYEFSRIFHLGVVIIVLFFIPFFISGTTEIIIKICLLIAYPIILYITKFFTEEENRYIHKKLNMGG